MKKIKIKYLLFFLFLMTSILMLVSLYLLAVKKSSRQVTPVHTSFTAPTYVSKYDSEDTAIITANHINEKKLQLQSIQNGKRYTLSYDKVNSLLDKYEKQMASNQLFAGMLVTVRFYKEDKTLFSLQENTTGFHIDSVTNYTIHFDEQTMTYQNKTYQFHQNLSIFSDEQELSLQDIQEIDELSIWGFSNQIYSIQIKKGHSFLRLENEAYFIDGWIEVGKDVIKKVTDQMLLVVPEGKQQVTISHAHNRATQEIMFPRNEEIVWDLGTVEIKQPQSGNIIFTITPDSALVMIDGNSVDISKPVTLDYGVHQIIVSADGYQTLSKYMKVADPSATISINLEKSEETANNEETKDEKTNSDTEKSNDTEEKDATESTSAYQIHIDAPQNVELYFDGNYIGITPINIKKESGDHIVTLRKDGFQTRSYTLQIDQENKDVNYSFSELLATK